MEVIRKYPNAPLMTLDWSVAASPPSPSLAARVLEALETQGFFYLTNVAGYSADELEKAAKWFYGKPLDFKMQVARKGEFSCFVPFCLFFFASYYSTACSIFVHSLFYFC